MSLSVAARWLVPVWSSGITMQLPMKLRTRLFLSISALITVALLGLLLGLFSVTQMASSQSELIQRGFNAVEIGQKLRQHLQHM